MSETLGLRGKGTPMTSVQRATPRPVSAPARAQAPSPASAARPATAAAASSVAVAEKPVSRPTRQSAAAKRRAFRARNQELLQARAAAAAPKASASRPKAGIPAPAPAPAAALAPADRRITGWQALGLDKNSADARYLVGGVAGEAGRGEEIAIARAMLNRTDGYHDGKASYPGGSMRDILSRRGQFSTIGHHYHGNVDQAGLAGGPRAAEKARVRELLDSTKSPAEWAALGARHDMEYFQSPGGGRYARYSADNTFNGGKTRFSKTW